MESQSTVPRVQQSRKIHLLEEQSTGGVHGNGSQRVCTVQSITPNGKRKRRTTRWGPAMTKLTHEPTPIINENDRIYKSGKGGTATTNRQQSHCVIIDDDDLGQPTLPGDITVCDDETVESTFSTSRCISLGNSCEGNIQPATHPIRSGSHFRAGGDESIGFDTFRHSYASIPSTSISLLEKDFGVNNIPWDKPIIINDNNIDDDCWKKYYPILHSNIFLVVEGPPKTGCAQVGLNERPLDHERWKARHTPFLICIAPPNRGCCQSYLLYDARECHYEVFGNRLIESIRGTDLSILLFPADGVNTRSAHCYVINEQKYLNSFSSSFPQMEALSLLKKYQDVSTKSNKRHVAAPADFGICSK